MLSEACKYYFCNLKILTYFFFYKKILWKKCAIYCIEISQKISLMISRFFSLCEEDEWTFTVAEGCMFRARDEGIILGTYCYTLFGVTRPIGWLNDS